MEVFTDFIIDDAQLLHVLTFRNSCSSYFHLEILFRKFLLLFKKKIYMRVLHRID